MHIFEILLLRKHDNEDLVLLKLDKYKIVPSILLIVNSLGSTRHFFVSKTKVGFAVSFFPSYIYSPNSLKHFIFYKKAIF